MDSEVLRKGESTPQGVGTPPAVEFVGITKAFGATVAVNSVDLTLRSGEVLALVGENGAGKSTLAKILGGVYHPDLGVITVNGTPAPISSPLDAQRLGISIVHQHPGLFPDLDIAENVFAGQPILTSAGTLDIPEMRRRTAEILDRLGLDVAPTLPVAALRTSEQQLVEIARALAAGSRVIVLDEPTAALTTGEVERLFAIVSELRADGVALMFVGHRLEEVFAISDRIAVLRDGVLVSDGPASDLDEASLVRLMVGRELRSIYPDRTPVIGDIVLSVHGLGDGNNFRDVDLDVRSGEIVGIAGLVGAGRTEIARVLFGINQAAGGSMELNGQTYAPRNPSEALHRGVAYVSEDRRGQSIIEGFSILENATLPSIDRAARFGVVRRDREIGLVGEALERMNLKFAGYAQEIGALSGGNQQKVVLAKWLATKPRLLILDEPTQGVDVHAKSEVHRIIAELSAQGIAILLISSDMSELMGMADRIHVMRQGNLVAEFDRENATAFDIGLAATAKASAAVEEVAVGGAAKTQRRAGSRLGRLLRRRELGLLLALAVIVIPLGLVNTQLFSPTNMADLTQTTALLSIVVLGEMLVMLTRNIDLSIGSMIGLSAFLSTGFMEQNPDMPVLAGVAVGVLVGLACGSLNGVIVAYGKVPSIVVTLGTLAIYRGILTVIASGVQISSNDVPRAWVTWATTPVFMVTSIIWIAAAILAIAAFILTRLKPGRSFFMTGSNPEGAELIGVRSKRTVFAAFALSGAFAGLYGTLIASQLGQVDGGVGLGVELSVIASAVVGGVALRGGRGGVVGVILGTLTLVVIQNALALAHVPAENLQAVYGAAILFAVAVDVVLANNARSRKGSIA